MSDDKQLIPEADLAAWLKQDGCKVLPSSPLAAITENTQGGKALDISDDVADAIRCVASPAVDCGVRLSTPERRRPAEVGDPLYRVRAERRRPGGAGHRGTVPVR